MFCSGHSAYDTSVLIITKRTGEDARAYIAESA